MMVVKNKNRLPLPSFKIKKNRLALTKNIALHTKLNDPSYATDCVEWKMEQSEFFNIEYRFKNNVFISFFLKNRKFGDITKNFEKYDLLQIVSIKNPYYSKFSADSNTKIIWTNIFWVIVLFTISGKNNFNGKNLFQYI